MATRSAPLPGSSITYPIVNSLFADEPSKRHREVLLAAAALFAERGYAATSIRDIGERAGLLGGSLYHHIKSKESLFVKIHEAALEKAEHIIREAVAKFTDPWSRLETACITFCQIQLDPKSLTMPLMSDFLAVPSEVRLRLIVKRDEFEKLFVSMVDSLPLSPKFDRNIYRLLLLTLLNNIICWYRPGRLTPEDVGRQIMLIFRHQMQDAKPKRRP